MVAGVGGNNCTWVSSAMYVFDDNGSRKIIIQNTLNILLKTLTLISGKDYGEILKRPCICFILLRPEINWKN